MRQVAINCPWVLFLASEPTISGFVCCPVNVLAYGVCRWWRLGDLDAVEGVDVDARAL